MASAISFKGLVKVSKGDYVGEFVDTHGNVVRRVDAAGNILDQRPATNAEEDEDDVVDEDDKEDGANQNPKSTKTGHHHDRDLVSSMPNRTVTQSNSPYSQPPLPSGNDSGLLNSHTTPSPRY
jgi:hypothetical protein